MSHYSFKVKAQALPGDLTTPIGTYLKVRDLFPQSVLMESSDYHGAENNRSFIGLDPIAVVSVAHGIATLRFPDGATRVHTLTDSYNVADAIDDFMKSFSVEGEYAAYCGLYGYTGFNAVRYFEHIPIKDSTDPLNDAPDIIYILYRYLLVFNGFRDELVLLELLTDDEESHADTIRRALDNNDFALYDFHTHGPITSPLTDEEHKANIRRGIKHCKRGDVFQIVISRRFQQHFTGDDFRVYRALRSINPSPYLFYFDFGGFHIFGSSPETHCRIESGRAYIDPIAGTTKRRATMAEDEAAAAALNADPKENAEHVMLVDLARNDLSRNCTGVKVDFFKETQFYSHVIHLVSRVSGDVCPNTNPIKLLADTFPAGTLSGAPKVRALQLISEYEPHCRGAYGGCLGFIGFNGSLNQAITIRTFVSRNGCLTFQAGGGIVAASNEENELQEVNNKLGALRRAIIQAESDITAN